MTAAEFRAKAVALFLRANPEARIQITWKFTGRQHRNPRTGRQVRHGHFLATAPGYQPRTVIAFHDLTTGEWSVR